MQLTTPILQLLDRAVFGPFGAAYNAACSDLMSESPLNMVIKIAWEIREVIYRFHSCGIFPLNKHVIPASEFVPSFPTDVHESQAPVSSSAVMSTPESRNLPYPYLPCLLSLQCLLMTSAIVLFQYPTSLLYLRPVPLLNLVYLYLLLMSCP